MTRTVKRKKISIGDVLAKTINYVLLTIVGIITVVPFLYVVSMSFTSDAALGSEGVKLIPAQWSVAAYKYLFENPQTLFQAYAVTIFVTVMGTFLATLNTILFAYPVSKKSLPGRKGIMLYILFSMMFSGGIIPFYLVVRNVLGLGNSLWALIIPGCFSSWNMILMRNFFQSLPQSLEESAKLDGANDVQILFKIIIPLSKSIIATIALFFAVGFWNAWYNALLFIDDTAKQPLMMFLKTIMESRNVGSALVGSSSMAALPPSEALRMATVVACTLPILCVYPFIQKYFVSGMMVGSIKG